MKIGDGASKVAYNVQSAVDEKHKLLVHRELTNEPNDERSLLPTALGAKQALGAETLNVVADAGTPTARRRRPASRQGSRPTCRCSAR